MYFEIVKLIRYIISCQSSHSENLVYFGIGKSNNSSNKFGLSTVLNTLAQLPLSTSIDCKRKRGLKCKFSKEI